MFDRRGRLAIVTGHTKLASGSSRWKKDHPARSTARSLIVLTVDRLWCSCDRQSCRRCALVRSTNRRHQAGDLANEIAGERRKTLLPFDQSVGGSVGESVDGSVSRSVPLSCLAELEDSRFFFSANVSVPGKIYQRRADLFGGSYPRGVASRT